MKKAILVLFFLAACAPAGAETFSGEVLGISVIRKAIFVQYETPEGAREVAKLQWTDALPEKKTLENAEIGDKIRLEAAKGDKDEWLVKSVSEATAHPEADDSTEDLSMPVTEAAPPVLASETPEPVPAPVPAAPPAAAVVPAPLPGPAAPVFAASETPDADTAYREIQDKLATGEARLVPAPSSEAPAPAPAARVSYGSLSGSDAPESNAGGDSYSAPENTRRRGGNPFGFLANTINGAARSVKGAVDSTGRAVRDVLP